MRRKKIKLHEVVGVIGVLMGIGGFFTGMLCKQFISGWLILIYPISLLIGLTSAGLGAYGTDGSIIYALWFLIFLSSSIFIAVIFSKIAIIPVPIGVAVTLAIAGLMAKYIVSKINEKL